jgi:glycosyltransferase involved in cell wall biosynthesis
VSLIISEPDKGIYDAMNKGIKAATGDVIGILNSDDFFTSNDVISAVVSTFKNNDWEE